jgi:hypothetical protein
MAGKRDEVFLLGEEELGGESSRTLEEEATATVSVPAQSTSGRLRVGWPLILGPIAALAVLALLARPGGDGAEPARPRAEAPAVDTTPEVHSVARAPREARRSERAPERRPSPSDRRTAAQKPQPAPLAETASIPLVPYAPTPVPIPEPPPGGQAVPAPATPLPAPRPEFGIER